MDLDFLSQKCSSFRNRHRDACKALERERSAILAQRKRLENALKAQAIIQDVAKTVQEQAHEQIATVVTRCLKVVFGDQFEFRIDFERKRGKTEAKLVFLEDRNEIDPKEGSGGGLLDVAAFALQIACVMLKRPKRRRLLVSDEPFKFLSEYGGFKNRMRDLIETLADELGFQFVLVTHAKTFEVGKVIRL